ncbi:DUF6325 family protein [Microbacterium immunditiarum]|uniref:Putative membrane protein n=1 Tax=Microbacterium immunditiarum TaxID=337480 RepID=A0A7Y9GKZ2_9MICO|nr:DUF6325 family protein [Microbacterium immunditiarum]NYE18359.1 putative membrane protein [Microbacterium immunditiarum]
MAEFRYGPVELFVIGFEGERPDPSVLSALFDLVESGTVRLLDFVIVSKSESGDVEIIEIEEELDEYGLGNYELAALGITGEEDIVGFAEHVPAGSSAAVVAIELAFVRELAGRLAETGGIVLTSERIPAPVVNAVADLADAELEAAVAEAAAED